jgi:5-methylcytosine-specific restriction endonuclease McrA
MTDKQREKIKELKEELIDLRKKLRGININSISKLKNINFIKGVECAICGNKNNLNIHHLKPKNMGGNNNPENLITLCKSCHLFMHCNPILIMKEKIEHRNKTLNGIINVKKKNLIGKRGKDKRPRKIRIDERSKRIKKDYQNFNRFSSENTPLIPEIKEGGF